MISMHNLSPCNTLGVYLYTSSRGIVKLFLTILLIWDWNIFWSQVGEYFTSYFILGKFNRPGFQETAKHFILIDRLTYFSGKVKL